MCENDQLDLLIDSAVATYAEPPAGLEGRVHQAITAAREENPTMQRQASMRRRWMPWLIALPVAACLMLALYVQFRGPNHPSQAQNPPLARQPLPSSSHAQPNPTIALTPASTHMKKDRHGRPIVHPAAPETQTAALPKLDVFPTPQPLTSQEQALVVFVAQTPETERKAVAEAQQQIETPISVAAIHIPPLELPVKGQP